MYHKNLTGEEIRKLRKARHLTHQQLADMMSIGMPIIKRWETGTVQSASIDHAQQL
jgi:DNA-binding transcriptional regulator YiaG